ncbi:MAG: YkgJ family cysteine cluster protein [Desulfobacterales bacterium]|jgi:Fe-S-cluster containining protein
MDFAPYFLKYEALAKAADQVFERVKQEFPDCVKCKVECSDCCHALFDLTLIEALYMNEKFKAKYSGEARERLLEDANRADRSIHKLKRQAYRDLKDGKTEDEILSELGDKRVRCPLLNERDMCELYEHRPITCRLYGIPTSIGGKGRTCSLSAFEPGEAYPTVDIDKIHGRLQEISAELLRDIQSANIKLADILMPLSMAMMTVFDDHFMGVGDPPSEKESS